MIPVERSKSFGLGRKVGFTLGFVVFFSMFYLILSLQNKVPEGFGYWHFLVAGIILSIIVIFVRGVGVEKRKIIH